MDNGGNTNDGGQNGRFPASMVKMASGVWLGQESGHTVENRAGVRGGNK